MKYGRSTPEDIGTLLNLENLMCLHSVLNQWQKKINCIGKTLQEEKKKKLEILVIKITLNADYTYFLHVTDNGPSKAIFNSKI